MQRKQKTAYEIRLSLVGSEMCIRDSSFPELDRFAYEQQQLRQWHCRQRVPAPRPQALEGEVRAQPIDQHHREKALEMVGLLNPSQQFRNGYPPPEA